MMGESEFGAIRSAGRLRHDELTVVLVRVTWVVPLFIEKDSIGSRRVSF